MIRTEKYGKQNVYLIRKPYKNFFKKIAKLQLQTAVLPNPEIAEGMWVSGIVKYKTAPSTRT